MKLAGFSHLAVDPVHGHVFITEGAAQQVVVADHSGDVLAQLKGLNDPEGLVVSPDSSTVYVALSTSHEIIGIDTTTFEVTSTIDTGDGTCPGGVAFAADLLWFSYSSGCGESGWVLGAVDLDTQTVFPGLTEMQDGESAPTLASLPTQPNALVASGVSIWDVTGASTPTATLRAARDLDGASATPTPDGTQVVVPYGNDVLALNTSDLSTNHEYLASTYPSAATVSADGMVATGASRPQGPQIKLYLDGQTDVYGSYRYDAETTVARDGLAFGPTFLFAVTQHAGGSDLLLHAFLPKGSAGLTLTTDKNLYRYQASSLVSVHLTHGVENRTVSIYAQEVNGPKRLIKRGSVNAQGDLSVTSVVDKRTTFSASYSGDDHTNAGAASHQVLVQAKVVNRLQGYYRTIGQFRIYHTSQNPKIVATISPNKSGKCVYYGAQYWAGDTWLDMKPSRCFKLNGHSQSIVYFVGNHQAGQRFRLHALWHDDGQNTRTEGGWSYFRFTR